MTPFADRGSIPLSVKGDKTMTAIDTAPSFAGIYGIPEVARYLAVSPPLTNGHKVPTARLRYWIRTSVPHILPTEYPTRQRFITFPDLVSMRMVAMLRSEGVKLHEIRTTEKYLRKEFDLQWPFATRSLWTYGHHVFICFEEKLLTVSKFGQQAMGFVKGWLKEIKPDMTFDKNDLASTWFPYDGICLNPKIQFGEPCIEGTRVTTRTIWSNFKAGDSLDAISTLYELDISQMKNAVEWERRLDTTRSRTILRN